MQDIGVGLVGYGLGGRAFHAPYVRITKGLNLRAVISGDAAKVHADLPDMRVVPSVEALLALANVDLVIVSSPDALHAQHAVAALRAGKHVLIDKPFATSVADARQVMREAEIAGRMLTVFHNRRWDADFLTLRRLLSEDVLGDVVTLESHFDRWRPVPAQVWKEARAGGSWLDLGPHLVDQALCLFGRPEAISLDLASLREAAPAPDYFHAVFRYPRRRVVLHSSKLAVNHRLRFAVHGSRGSWIKHGIDPQEAATVAGRLPEGDDWGIDPSSGMLTTADEPAQAIPAKNEKGDYRLFWKALVLALRGQSPNPVPPEEALAVMEVLDAGMRSSEQRREIDLEPTLWAPREA